ncbi:malate synthase G [Alkalicoccus chagannorensis]|uniref:malate synthase G n=1 Tax=Alkalicoccus chagannorensis TaxID=427072 RepID=UPI0003F85226|nr:malate synthase G [Alkalicoccus chagannorensis]
MVKQEKHGLQVDQALVTFLEARVLPETAVDSASFWKGFASLTEELEPEINRCLHRRTELQEALDSYHLKHPGRPDPAHYQSYLKEIGYLEEPPEVQPVTAAALDPEVFEQAGPQLVVPLTNARYVLNAANARWGSLYDALYGSDVISDVNGAEAGTAYNPVRGERVIRFARLLLDEWLPLEQGSHADAASYDVEEGELVVQLEESSIRTRLQDPAQFLGPTENGGRMFRHHRLHIEMQVDPGHPVGRQDPAGVKDILMEAALTSIMDAEDSVAAVDTEDKLLVYSNWLGLMDGTLETEMEKGGRTFTRRLAEDRTYIDRDGREQQLKGRALMLIRNVGHLMKTDMVTWNGQPVSEGIVDAVVTAAAAMIDRKKRRNSEHGSMYIVKPKMHGTAEAALTNELFSKVETLLGLPQQTIKVGVMDEERRTSLHLDGAIQAVRERIFFINTGFLDRTGDEIHTSFLSGPLLRKQEMKQADWFLSYEEANVTKGRKAELHKSGQIGKGMWPMPDEMKQMVEQKNGQLLAGGTTAWVPSPTAAVLHALHYHDVDTANVQPPENDGKAMLEIPIAEPGWSREEIRYEMETNVQAVLGYVVRWVEHGIGCSKVPNLEGTGLMEDRATLRIASQLMANWLHQGIYTEAELTEVMEKMAALVDAQNAHDPDYRPMMPEPEQSAAYRAARALIVEGKKQPNGYTEPILHEYRKAYKEAQKQTL